MAKKGKVHINSGGGPVFMERVDNRKGKIVGRINNRNKGLDADEIATIFEKLFALIEKHNTLSPQDKDDLKNEINELRQELAKKEKASESFLMRRLRNIGRMAPEILEVTLATITNPILGYGVIAKKIAERARVDTS